MDLRYVEVFAGWTSAQVEYGRCLLSREGRTHNTLTRPQGGLRQRVFILTPIQDTHVVNQFFVDILQNLGQSSVLPVFSDHLNKINTIN